MKKAFEARKAIAFSESKLIHESKVVPLLKAFGYNDLIYKTSTEEGFLPDYYSKEK
jgi:hypothetical protein